MVNKEIEYYLFVNGTATQFIVTEFPSMIKRQRAGQQVQRFGSIFSLHKLIKKKTSVKSSQEKKNKDNKCN